MSVNDWVVGAQWFFMLYFIGINQIIGGNSESSRSNLFDCASR